MLNFRLEIGSILSIKLEEEGNARRILYLDTLKGRGTPAVDFLIKLHLRANSGRSIDTLSFQEVILPPSSSREALRLIAETGRLFFRGQKIRIGKKRGVFWKGEKHSERSATLHPFIDELPLDAVDILYAGWAIYQGEWFEIETSIPWKWIELFRSGKRLLEGSEKKNFLDEEPPILWNQKEEIPFAVLPLLLLTDPSGVCANLWMEYTGGKKIAFEDLAPEIGGKTRLKKEEMAWEKDLIEAGYLKKVVGNSRYYCPGDKVEGALRLLLEIGWSCFDSQGRKILHQTACDLKIGEKGNALFIQGKLRFGEKEGSLSKIGKRLFMELDPHHVGLLDTQKIPLLEGPWVENSLLLPKRKIGEILPLLENEHTDWEEPLKKAAVALKQGEGVTPLQLTSAFQGNLLPYQQKGVEWLFFLKNWGFGALLADEMGLGKTVQAVAFFSQLRTNLPILIVAPTSLLFNWRYELNRFWPEAKVYVHSGPNREKSLNNCQIILTSYAYLRIDQELLASYEFEVIALDESHAIKTATSQTAQAACRLKGRFKMALSGTPVENRKEELVSQFHFLMPDLLEKELSHPESIRRKVKPFLLRRSKGDVQIELPEKIDHPVWIDFTEEQEALYDKTLSAFKQGLLRKVEQDGLNAHRMEVLEVILRLRQISADPRLVEGAYSMGGKAEMLLAAAEESAASGKKGLVFSQFTTFLRLLEKDLKKRGITPLYLDGSTPEAERGELIARFQNEEAPHLFLLSLKAGGVGLNLTAAENVFLLDPWWNEAVERQAIDRAHRIGQKKTVLVQRYLTPQSIEEKMVALKTSKIAAVEGLFEEGCTWSGEDLLNLLN